MAPPQGPVERFAVTLREKQQVVAALLLKLFPI